MKLNNIVILPMLAGLLLSQGCSKAESATERVAYKMDEINTMDGGDLCPKVASAKYHHHLILVDATMALSPSQIKLIENLVLPEKYLETLAPWDRVTVMRLMDVKPVQNKPLFSKCRPRSGDPTSIHKIDKHNKWRESESDVSSIYRKLFVGGINDVIKELADPTLINDSEDRLNGSPIMGQIKEISRLPDLDFTKESGYQSRKLTIVSDLAQNTERLPFYEYCSKTCPTWDSFKQMKKFKRWAKKALPDFGENIEIELIYLNKNFDPDINKNLLDFWRDFFKDAGILAVDDRIESDAG